MAEVILSPLLDLIFGNLASSAMQDLQLGWGMDKELQNLKSHLLTIQAVLDDAEEKQFHSKAVQVWLQKLKHAAYDADDLVDEIVTEAQQSKAAESRNEAAAGMRKRKRQVWDYFSSLFNSSQRGTANRINEINARLDQITKERKGLCLEVRLGGVQHEITIERRPPVSSVRDESFEVLGRENDKEEIISCLLSDGSGQRKFSVIAIVGMGGVGKTTLAQVVYNDEKVTENFELRAWVCVSEDFDIKRLTKEIIASISKTNCDLQDIDSLQCSLRDKLNGKKFLLVLDDVWSENGSDWDQLRPPFTFGAKGSKIVVTTRNQAVSNAMQAASAHNLKCLSEQDCWSVFVSQAFYDDNATDYPELIKIGKELVNKCRGLPLAAKALGGLLSSKRRAKEWENILKSQIWNWRGPASNILPALRLSYQYLPAHLKRCFTFCAVFPKDYEFEEKKLTLLWVALGFIRLEGENQIEDTASEYFNDLLLRSFFQLSKDTMGGTIYKMHDLVHDLAQFMSSDECVHMECHKSLGVHGKTQHLSYSVNEGELINFESFYESKGLRTFLLMNAIKGVNEKVPHDMFERLISIRVLDLSGSKITELPNSIDNLKHLRYFNLSTTCIQELPGSIGSIYNMQTLILGGCVALLRLPNEIRKLTNMRHLDLEECMNIESMPPQIGSLSSLQTLPWFIVGKEKEGGIVELKELTDIRGKLVIKKLENVTEATDAGQANLKNKPFIDDLSLEWSIYREWSTQDEGLEEELLKELQPHLSLKRLELDGYMGSNFPNWMMKMDTCLSNLTAVYLRRCRRCTILPPLGRLPFLSFLEITGMDQVEKMGAETCAGGFPSLKEIIFYEMAKLEQWQVESGGVGVLLFLQSIRILDCPQLQQIQLPYSNSLSNLTKFSIGDCGRLVSLPWLPSLKELELECLDNLEEWCDVVSGEAHFPHLQSMNISHCPKMRRWPSVLPVLTQLSISFCEGLDELPPPLWSSLSELTLGGAVSQRLLDSVSCLTSLSTLRIQWINNLTSMPREILQALTQLESLMIRSCNQLVTLEDDVLPSTLKQLIFESCNNLKSLPRALHAVTSLLCLEINRCPCIASLPEEGLPSSLERLKIEGCPMLEERCLKDVGEDWHKISHISHVDLP